MKTQIPQIPQKMTFNKFDLMVSWYLKLTIDESKAYYHSFNGNKEIRIFLNMLKEL